MIYALGALELFEEFTPEGGWQRVRLVIHQPRINAAPSEWDCAVEDLRAFATKVGAAVAVAESAKSIAKEDPLAFDKYLEPGDKQCKFCDAKPTCPALARAVQDTIGASFEDLTKADVKAPAELEQLERKYKVLELIESWCKAVGAAFEARLLAGETHPDWKLVEGRKGNRAWIDEDGAEKLLKSFRLKQEQMYSFKLISPPQAEKLLKGQPKRWEKVDSHIGQTDGKPSVAPATDKRPAIVVTPAADEFTNLEELV
jgi:hypothetical protein